MAVFRDLCVLTIQARSSTSLDFAFLPPAHMQTVTGSILPWSTSVGPHSPGLSTWICPAGPLVAILPPFPSPLGSSLHSSDCHLTVPHACLSSSGGIQGPPHSAPADLIPCTPTSVPLGAPVDWVHFSHLHVCARPSAWNAVYPPCLTGKLLLTLMTCYHHCVALLSHSKMVWGALLGSCRPLYFPRS